MPLSDAQALLFADLGASMAVRLEDVMEMASDSVRVVLRFLLRRELDPLTIADRESALDLAASACERRWRTVPRRSRVWKKSD